MVWANKGPKNLSIWLYVFRQWCSTHREKTGGPIAISERAYFWRYPKNVGVEFGNVTNFGPTKFNVLLLQLFSFFPENYVADQRHWPWDVPDQRKIWGKKTHRYQSRDTLSKLAQVSNIRKRNNHFCNTILSHLIIGPEESASFNRWIENHSNRITKTKEGIF